MRDRQDLVRPFNQIVLAVRAPDPGISAGVAILLETSALPTSEVENPYNSYAQKQNGRRLRDGIGLIRSVKWMDADHR